LGNFLCETLVHGFCDLKVRRGEERRGEERRGRARLESVFVNVVWGIIWGEKGSLAQDG
jgi:hypothetical protein